MLRFCDNPAVVHPQVEDLAAVPGTWWIGHTKARCEKAFAVDLTALNIAYFLPMVERVTFSGGRKRRGMLPLFSGCVFFAGVDEQIRQQAMYTDRLCRVLEVPDQQRLITGMSMVLQVLREKTSVERLLSKVRELEQFSTMEIAPQLLDSISSISLEAARRAS